MTEQIPEFLLTHDINQIDDYHLVNAIKSEIEEAIIENRVYYDEQDIAEAIEIIYPVVAGIVFNVHFRHIRKNADNLCDLIDYLTTHLV